MHTLETYDGSIRQSYFSELESPGLGNVLQLRGADRPWDGKVVRRALLDIIRRTTDVGHEWSISFVGPWREHQCETVLQVLTHGTFEAAYRMSDLVKPAPEYAPPWCEIAFGATLDLLQELLLGRELNVGWDFQMSGWLLPRANGEVLHPFKYERGSLRRPDPASRLAFSTSEEWDAIGFFTSDQTTRDAVKRYLKECEYELVGRS